MVTKSSVIPRCYCVVWGVSGDVLQMQIISKTKVVACDVALRNLDATLLPMLQQRKREMRHLRGIAIATSRLGSFASSRILLATFTTYAWVRDLPVRALPRKNTPAAPTEMFQFIDSLFSGVRHFDGQALPDYERPADITQSKKKQRFRIE